MKIPFLSPLRTALMAFAALSLTGCAVIEAFLPARETEQPFDVVVAQTVAAFPTLPPEVVTQEPQAPLPTYTDMPTYTPYPTYTPQPTYTSEPTFTALPEIVFLPPATQPPFVPLPTVQSSGHPYVLRVRNQNTKATLWIGTVMPYGGNFIKPLYYVEFYPPGPTWFRIWWCRRNVYYKNWYNDFWNDWYSYWNQTGVYNCQSKDVYLDKPFKEIGVK